MQFKEVKGRKITCKRESAVERVVHGPRRGKESLMQPIFRDQSGKGEGIFLIKSKRN